jgi:hypothetical protein
VREVPSKPVKFTQDFVTHIPLKLNYYAKRGFGGRRARINRKDPNGRVARIFEMGENASNLISRKGSKYASTHARGVFDVFWLGPTKLRVSLGEGKQRFGHGVQSDNGGRHRVTLPVSDQGAAETWQG